MHRLVFTNRQTNLFYFITTSNDYYDYDSINDNDYDSIIDYDSINDYDSNIDYDYDSINDYDYDSINDYDMIALMIRIAYNYGYDRKMP